MSNKRQETIADIVADIRAQNQGLPEDSYALSPLVCDLLSLARRIEVANAREIGVAHNYAQICGEIGEMIGREASKNQSVTNCNHLGNAAKMREALENIVDYAKAAACHTEDAHLLGYLNQMARWAESALSAPPRNCDVGTSEEQDARHSKWCRRYGIDGDMEVACAHEDMSCALCALRWEQMPYEEGGAK